MSLEFFWNFSKNMLFSTKESDICVFSFFLWYFSSRSFVSEIFLETKPNSILCYILLFSVLTVYPGFSIERYFNIVISIWWQLDLLWHIQNDTNLVFVWQLSFWEDQGPTILGYNLWLILIPRWTVLDRSHRLPVKPWNKQFIIDYKVKPAAFTTGILSKSNSK